MQELARLLKTEILKGLPGTEIQWQMASSDRFAKNFPRIPGTDAMDAAVLILLYPKKGSYFTVFMQRPDYEGIHSGQISFPGGKREISDKNIIETAVREAKEEIGADPAKISVIGTLTPLFIPVSNTVVTPVIGTTDQPPCLKHNPDEVVFIIEADIKRLTDPTTIKTKAIEIGGEIIKIKYFDYDGNVIWGATAMILSELLTLITRINFRFVE